MKRFFVLSLMLFLGAAVRPGLALPRLEAVHVTLDYVAKRAEQRARKPFRSPRVDLPDFLSKLTYDQYGQIRFREDQALWHEGLPFRVEFFHLGYLYQEPVHQNEFSSTHVQPVRFSPDFFDYGGLRLPSEIPANTGYAGFRVEMRWGPAHEPEETAPPPELAALRERMAALEASGQIAPRPADGGLADAVLDPYVNAIHVSLLSEKRQNPAYAQALAKLGVGKPEVRLLCEKLLAQGPGQLRRTEKLLILSDTDVLPWLHRRAWLRPSGTLSRWWQEQIRQYAR